MKVTKNKSKLIGITLISILICCVCGSGYIEITNLKQKEVVSWRQLVEGNSSATKDSGLNVYVLIWPIDADGPWYVQPSAAVFYDGSWRIKAYFGRDPGQYPEDSGTTYKITAIATNKTFESGKKFDKLPIELPSNKSQEIIVIRS